MGRDAPLRLLELRDPGPTRDRLPGSLQRSKCVLSAAT
jgi:hypothetical protein